MRNVSRPFLARRVKPTLRFYPAARRSRRRLTIRPVSRGGGVWTRAVVGADTTHVPSNSNISLTITPGGVHPIQVAVSQPCSSPVKTSFAGYEVGHDIAVLNADSSEWRFGVLAGYVGSKIDPGSLAPILPPGTADGNSPSAGLYAAYSKGAFSADIQARR
jgi:hypothetical protein